MITDIVVPGLLSLAGKKEVERENVWRFKIGYNMFVKSLESRSCSYVLWMHLKMWQAKKKMAEWSLIEMSLFANNFPCDSQHPEDGLDYVESRVNKITECNLLLIYGKIYLLENIDYQYSFLKTSNIFTQDLSFFVDFFFYIFIHFLRKKDILSKHCGIFLNKFYFRKSDSPLNFNNNVVGNELITLSIQRTDHLY